MKHWNMTNIFNNFKFSTLGAKAWRLNDILLCRQPLWKLKPCVGDRGPNLDTQSELWSVRRLEPLAKVKACREREKKVNKHPCHWSLDSHVWWRGGPSCLAHQHISPALPGNNCMTQRSEGQANQLTQAGNSTSAMWDITGCHKTSFHKTRESQKWFYSEEIRGGDIWLTLCASHRSGGCSQIQSCPSL